MAVMEEMLETLQAIKLEISELKMTGPAYSDSEKAALSKNELADFLGVSKSLIYEQTRQGKIPHVKLGSKAIYPKSEIVRWLKGESSDRFAEAGEEAVLQLLS